jgi:hypothetical protein
MHDTDTFARLPASGSAAAQPHAELLHQYDDEREVAFKNEVYRVRDNGAVWRRARVGTRRRKWDDVWTFGSLNKHTGYLVISDHVVHRIVAVAFHGENPAPGHVVDHIDTNRLNNRAENLRWVTRLENILLNPISLARIEFAYGSLEAFFANPGAQSVANWDWMRTVTKEEAAQSLARLRKWAKEGKAPTGGTLGEWLFAPKANTPKPVNFDPDKWTHHARPDALSAASAPELIDIPSLTPGAFQRRWRTPTEFPSCPPTTSDTTLDEYLGRLEAGTVFARNRYGENTVVEAGKASDGSLSVVCKTASGVKDWSVARVFMEGDAIYHESGGMFFDIKGAMKSHLRALGTPFDEAAYESIDDYA